MQNNKVNKNSHLIKALQNAQKRAMQQENKLKKWDNSFAVFRLLSTILLVSLLVALWPGKNTLAISAMLVFFLLFCLVTARFHLFIQKKLAAWKAYVLSYELSAQRIKRDSAALSQHKSPWHDFVVQESSFKNHIYASDLDVSSELFLLLNTCTTPNGSKNLFQLLMTAGIEPESQEKIYLRSQQAEVLSKQSCLLRRFESFRFSDLYLKDYYRNSSNSKERFSNNSDSNERLSSNNIIPLVYALISIVAWGMILLPSIFLFFKTQNVEVVLRPLFIYLWFLILGTLVFQKLISHAKKIALTADLLTGIVHALSLRKKRSLNNIKTHLNFSFFAAEYELKSLNFLLDLLSLRGNPVFWLTLHLFLPFDALVCLFLQFKKRKIDVSLQRWETELYEFDLLASFAIFARENPSCRFLAQSERENASADLLECVEIGHPLIPADKRVCNSILLKKQNPVVLLTGSNMAGKSTFLRTIGVNILLANMGAPVCADKFLIPRSRLLCAIRIDDSLSEGTSYFYAEVKRLRFILDALSEENPIPGLFLIDEIFRGTNNKERFIGSTSIIHALIEKNSFGFISTHDLVLSELEKENKQIKNMHFREHIEDDKLIFDYLIKEGPCPTTNALYIMRIEGLPVPV